MGALYVAKTSGVTLYEGRRVRVFGGKTIAEEGNPFLAARRGLFRPLAIHFPASPVAEEETGPAETDESTTPADPPADTGSTDPDAADAANTGDGAGDKPQRPPLTGKGSGVDAWREYAAAVTGAPAASYGALGRDEIIALLKSEGVDES